jgi:sec-independent protein translocase protein TatA
MLRNGLEPWHLVIVLIVVFMLFGAKRMPDTARALGKSLRILKSETRALKEDFKEGVKGTDEPGTSTATSTAQKTIKAAPGEPAGARTVSEPERTTS